MLKWTKEKPNKEGHYWTRLPDKTGVRVVVIAKGAGTDDWTWRVCAVFSNECGTPLVWFNPEQEWAGPIPQPVEG